MDGDDRKRPREASSFDDSISKAANNGKMFEKALKLNDCCNFMQLFEKFGRENELIISNHF